MSYPNDEKIDVGGLAAIINSRLAADARIEVGIDQIRMITRSCVCEQKLLSENASGREDGDLKVVCT